MRSRGKQLRRSPSRSTCVKLYLCSNPEDSVVERRALRETVFPKVRELCRHTLGLDLRVIDPFESSDPSQWPDEQTRRQLIKECRESSAGPFLLALVGHRYGVTGLPAQVEVSEYQMLLQQGQQAGIDTQQLERAYRRDENTIPASYCGYAQKADVKEKEEIKMRTNGEEQLRMVIQSTVSLCVQKGLMTPERAHHYYRSALDADLRFALDSCPKVDIIGRCLVYVHKVVNATGEREKAQGESQGSQAAAADPQTTPSDGQLFSELCDKFLPGLVTSAKLLVYTISTECDRRHGYTTARRRIYTESLCQQVTSDLLGLIDGPNVSVTEGGGTRLCDALDREHTEQEEKCLILSRFYDVIRPEEEQIRAYVEQREQRHPLVVTGGPCTGKTVLLAHCAQQIQSWLPDCDPVVLTYFCNLPVKPSPEDLLLSLCHQIAGSYHRKSSSEQNDRDVDDPGHSIDRKDYNSSCCPPTSGLDPRHEPTAREHLSDHDQGLSTITRSDPSDIIELDISLSELKERLSALLSSKPSPAQPIILILDVLDHAGSDFGSQITESLPSPFPPNVKVILKISLNQTQVLRAVDVRRNLCLSEGTETEPGPSCVQLGPVERKQCVKMLESLLSGTGRRVTSGQQVLVNQALTSCPLTLYARLLHPHTSLWRSDSDVTESSLPDGVHSSISTLLDNLERKHGPSFVAAAVSYLTLSRTGLTEAELADLLSCDDKVLSEYFQQGGTLNPDTRVPQVKLERLLLDLKGFLLSKTVSGSRVLFWVSRHFRLVADRRYMSSRETKVEFHSAMADYFCGRWACGNVKPLVLKQKSGPDEHGFQMEMSVDRQTPSQPFVFDSSSRVVGRVNLRKVLELPHHLRESDRWEELEHGVLMCFGFHQAMVRAGLLRDLIVMLQREEWSAHFSCPRARALQASILKSCACLLHSTPTQLPLVIETSLLPYLEIFPALEHYIGGIRQERRKRGSGLGLSLCPAPSSIPSLQVVKCNPETKDIISVLEATGTDCGVLAMVMDDGTAWIWKGPVSGRTQLSLSCEQKELKFAGVKSSGRFMLLSTRCNKLFLWDVTGPDMFLQLKDPLKSECESKSSHQIPGKIEGFVACQKKLFMSRKGENFVSVFDVPSDTLNHVYCQSCVTCLVCSSDGSYMYCGQEEGTVSLFDTNTGSLLGTCSNSSHNAVALTILREESREMVCVDGTGNVTLWDVAAQTQPPRPVKERLTVGKPDTVVNTDYSDDAECLLVCQPHQVTLWDACEWELLDQFLAPQGKTFAQAVLSQDGHLFLASLHACAVVLVWRVSTGECVLAVETNEQPHTLLKTASDVVCMARDGSLTVWDSKMIDTAGTAPKMRYGVREVVVEMMGEWFYTADGSDSVWRWRSETGLPHASFLHGGPVEILRLSPDDAHIVTLSEGEIYVWQTETGHNVLRMRGSKATDILITPNCNFGVSISDRHLSRVWKLLHGNVVCSINLYLSDACVSPESTYLLGIRRGDLLAASLWSGLISKRFSCVVSWEHVVAFCTLAEHPDFVVVMAASGAVYTWKVAEETVCKQFLLSRVFHCQPRDFQTTSNGDYALLSTEKEAVNLLDLSQVRLCSIKAEGPVVQSCLDKAGRYVAYICCPVTRDQGCVCPPHARPVLTVVRLADGGRLGSVRLPKNPLTLVVSEQQCVFVGFEDGSLGVYSVLDVMTNGEDSVGYENNLKSQSKKCVFEKAPLRWLPLTSPNITWS